VIQTTANRCARSSSVLQSSESYVMYRLRTSRLVMLASLVSFISRSPIQHVPVLVRSSVSSLWSPACRRTPSSLLANRCLKRDCSLYRPVMAGEVPKWGRVKKDDRSTGYRFQNLGLLWGPE